MLPPFLTCAKVVGGFGTLPNPNGGLAMKRMKLVVVILALGVGAVALSSHGQEPKREPKKPNDAIGKELSELMKGKLESSQKVLEGLAR